MLNARDRKLMADIRSGRRWLLKHGVHRADCEALIEAGLVDYIQRKAYPHRPRLARWEATGLPLLLVNPKRLPDRRDLWLIVNRVRGARFYKTTYRRFGLRWVREDI